MTPNKEYVKAKHTFYVIIKLANNYSVQAKVEEVRTVYWEGTDVSQPANLSGTLVYLDLSFSLLTVQELVRKNVEVLFIPGKSI